MKLSKTPLAPGCPQCGKGNYKKRNIAWLGVEIMLCSDCGYAAPVPTEKDQRQTHTADPRETKPL